MNFAVFIIFTNSSITIYFILSDKFKSFLHYLSAFSLVFYFSRYFPFLILLTHRFSCAFLTFFDFFFQIFHYYFCRYVFFLFNLDFLSFSVYLIYRAAILDFFYFPSDSFTRVYLFYHFLCLVFILCFSLHYHFIFFVLFSYFP